MASSIEEVSGIKISPPDRQLLAVRSDDLDDSDIAAYSVDVTEQAEEFKTLGQVRAEKDLAEKKMKEKEAQEKVM